MGTLLLLPRGAPQGQVLNEKTPCFSSLAVSALGSNLRHCVFCQSAEARRKIVVVVTSRTKTKLCSVCGGERENSGSQVSADWRLPWQPHPQPVQQTTQNLGPAAHESQSWRALQQGPGAGSCCHLTTLGSGDSTLQPPQYWGSAEKPYSAVPASDTPAPPPGHEGAEEKGLRGPHEVRAVGRWDRTQVLHLLGGRSPPSWPVCPSSAIAMAGLEGSRGPTIPNQDTSTSVGPARTDGGQHPTSWACGWQQRPVACGTG